MIPETNTKAICSIFSTKKKEWIKFWCLPSKVGILEAELLVFKGLSSFGISIKSGSSKSESSSLSSLVGADGFFAVGSGTSSSGSESKSSSKLLAWT